MGESPSERLARARAAAGYRTAKEFSDKHSIPQSTYHLHETGGRKISPSVAEDYAAKLKNCSAEWLLYARGEGPTLTPAYTDGRIGVRIDELDVRASAGPGALVDYAAAVSQWELPRELVRSATQSPPERIKFITIVGDSMEPMFRPNEKVMVDTGDTVPTPPGVFILWDGLGLVLKRVEHLAHSEPPTVRISSENPKYLTYERGLDEAYIQGRVIGKWLWT